MTKKSIQHGFISGRAYAKALQEQRSAITMDAADVAQYAALVSTLAPVKGATSHLPITLPKKRVSTLAPVKGATL